ncbi:MAG: glycosyl hydrolase, partial [Janthinobacterium lividum]
YALPLLTREDGQSLGSCAAGGNDEHFRVMAHNIVENGFGSAVVRPGWEGSADWYAWGVTNPRNGDTQQAQRAYRECFRRLAGIFREVAPDVIIELDYGTAGGLTNIADVYPGDDFVDVIGNDVYLPSTIRDAQDWNRFCRSGTARRPVGLCRYAEFAREHHKLFAVAEWGLDTTNAPDADAVAYVEGMARLFRDQRDILAYEAYYNRTDDPSSPCEFRLDGGCNPEAAATYLRLFGAAGSTG